ncbi:MAG: amino acid permease [Myxococcales bacterium]|nr:amino acid permease [Myxococcales bacterium]
MDPRERATSLPRTLGWASVAAYGLGAILGAGVYSVIGAAAGRVGDGMWLAFLISAVVALITALAYAELATMFPRAGGEFLYVQRAMPEGRILSFTVGAMMAVAAAATAATVAIAFGGYLSALASIPTGVAAPLLVAILAGVAIIGVRESTTMVALFTCIEAGGLVLVIVLGATSERFGEALAAVPTDGLLSGAALVFFAYLGFENIVNLAEETREPERNLPRAILASVGGATLLYLLVALAVVALIPAGDLARSDAPLADAVGTRSSALSGALGGIALFATANTAMAALISGSRILYAMAREGRLPAALARVGVARRTPWVATLAVAGTALALVPLGDVAIVAGLTSFASLLAFAAVNASVVVLRVRAASTPRPFHVPWAVGRVPVLSLLGAVLALVLVTQLDTHVLVAGAVLLALLVGASLLPVTRRRRAPA